MKKCIACGEEIHPKRLEILPTTTRCVACSNTDRKAGITITKGEGDHTYNETIIMERDEFIKYQEAELKARGQRPDMDPHPEDFFKEEVVENDEDEEEEIEELGPEDISPDDEDIFSTYEDED